MAREDIRKGIYSILSGAAVLALLGPVSSSNRRVYSGYPQEQPVLTGIGDPDEGWIVFSEDMEADEVGPFEYVTWRVEMTATRYTLLDDVLDVLDAQLNWRIEQEVAMAFGERYVINSRRRKVEDGYDEPRKLHTRMVHYWMCMIRSTPSVPVA